MSNSTKGLVTDCFAYQKSKSKKQNYIVKGKMVKRKGARAGCFEHLFLRLKYLEVVAGWA
jgi:hypothetical protein